jgi:glycosyltransferase involved in cell wall biosynthesis
MKYTISIVLPVYNEEAGIISTLKNLLPILKKTFSNYEIIIVESGSTDKSGEIADKLARKNQKIRVIHQGKRKGYSNGIREGLKHCKYDLSMYIDCDNPYDFKYLKEAVRYIGDYDAVIGYKQGKRESFGRLILSKGAYLLNSILFGLNVKDINYPFKMMKTNLVKKMSLYSNTSLLPTELLIGLKKQKAKIKEIQVPHKIRTEGKSKMGFIKMIIGHLIDIVRYLKNSLRNRM